MTTFPRGRRSSLGLASFADLTDVAVIGITKDAVTFAGPLDEETAALVTQWLDAKDDEDQIARAALRADRDALEPDDPVRHVIDYMLDRA